ncbi:MAG: NAD-dependent epimerase/dehydratase family protein, partial [Methanobacteriota archaeon]
MEGSRKERAGVTYPTYPWSSKQVLVTGGASFIGSTLVDALLDRGASVRIVDDFSSGGMRNIEHATANGSVQLLRGDLRDPDIAAQSVEG